MKKTYTFLKSIALATALLASNYSFSQTTAKLQIIHNAADPAAAEVDIYAGALQILDNVKFRTASKYIDAPAGIPVTIGVAPSTSMSAADAIFTTSVTLTPGETYVAVANGLVATGFAANPDNKNTAFGIWVKTGAKQTAAAGMVDLLVVHGSTDAPAVDVVAEGVATIVNNAVYGDITNYISVPAGSYTLAVKDSTGANTVARFTADLSTLGGNSAVVFASGFLDPSKNKNGSPFGLFAALPTGDVIRLDVVTGISDQYNAFSSFAAYPVPATNNLTVEFSNTVTESIAVEVLDMNGRSMIRQNENVVSGLNRINIDTQNLQAGTYLSRITGQANVSVLTFTVIK